MSAPTGKEKSALLRALLAIEDLEARLRESQRSAREPIAIVGLACRYPGADSADAFWRNLRGGVDAISEIPADRWDIDAYYDPDPDAPGKMYSRRGGFVRDLDRIDARFFGIAPREAVSLDPQQRLLLEVAWEALEDAAIPPRRLAGTSTGVFVGITGSDFSSLSARKADVRLIDPYSGTGSAVCVAPGRLSYILGLHGPSLAVDTACSSSLAAVHLACQSLRLGECRTALAGGVNAILAPEGSIYFCKIRALSKDGRCKTFDGAADGYVRGEGCGVIVLKRLSDAVADNDRILAVIRGSAMNHDGPSGGLTIPSGPAQEAVIRAALSNAGVQPAEVGYVEAHGTGTPLGDPIELHALGAVYKACAVGSVKTNIGHLEAGAGMAGLIKVVLSLGHREIPPHLHFTKPNPLVAWDRLPFTIPTSAIPWNERRMAGVSAFGFSGTNAHVIVEQAPEVAATTPSTRDLHILTLSAKTEPALQELVSRFRSYLADTTESLADICYTSNVGREHFAHRFALAAQSLQELHALVPAAHQSEVVSSYLDGAEIDWAAFHRDHGCRKVALPTYPFQRERYWSDALTPQPSCLYAVNWEACPVTSSEPQSTERGLWLVLGPPAFLATMERAGYPRTTAIPEDPDTRLSGVIQFAPPEESDAALVCEPTLHLVQRLSRLTTAPRLWLVTQGAQFGVSRPAQSALWGLAAVVASEFPALRCTRIDLDPASTSEAQAERLIQELRSGDAEDQVAWRGAQRYACRLTRLPAVAAGEAAIRSDATYLITGGLGAIGMQVAERLVDIGGRHLVLLGRRAPDAETHQRLDRMRVRGARVSVVEADVASPTQLTRAIEPYRESLRGVFHAAGVLDDGPLPDQTAARFTAVVAPKAVGAWNLHLATQDIPLEIFVLFSSAAALMGPPGQAGYAAANAFLDGLAAWRNAQGLPALSIAWGPWSETGMAAATARRGKARWRARGIRDIAPKDGLDILQRLLGTREPLAVVLPIDWNEFAIHLPAGLAPPLLREFLHTRAAAPPIAKLRDILAEAPPNRRRALLRDRVSEQAAKVLGLDASTLDPREPLAELGLDSLMAVELRNVLAAMAGAQLPATLLFDYPTVDALTGYLAADILALPPETAPVRTEDTSFLDTVEQLSEEEAESLLRQRLEAMQ